MPPQSGTKNIKIARLAIASADIPALANVWTKANGHFLIAGEINLPYATAQAVGSSLLARMDELWYEASGSLATTEEIMEAILAELNKTLSNILAPYTFNPQAPRYHLVAAFFRYPEVCVSTIGGAGAFVVSPTRFTNIIKSSVTDDNTGPIIAKKPLFQHIITGTLKPGESLFITNPGILDYFSVEKLRQVISQSTPGEATAAFDNMLKELDRQPAVSLIILKSPTREEMAGAEESVNRLVKTENKTAGILRPKLWNHIKSTANKLLPSKPHVIQKPPQTIQSPQPTHALAAKSSIYLKVLWQKIRRITIPWRPKEVKDAVENIFANGLLKFRRLPKMQKALPILIVILIFIFSYNIVSSSKANFGTGQSQNYQKLIEELNNYQKEIEASLIYNSAKVPQLLSEAQGLLEKLPQKNKAQKAQYQNYKASLGALTLRALNQVEVINPKLEIDANNLGDHNWQGMLWTDELIIFANDGLLAAKSADSSAKNLLTIPTSAGGIKMASSVNSKSALFISETGSAWLANFSANNSNAVNRVLPKITDMVYFDDGRLYLLGNTPGTIYRLDISDDNVSSPAEWLSTGQTELTNTNSLTVDGSIYVLRNGSTIEKYIRGTKREFATASINPTLTAATKIRTNATEDYIYILEPSSKRIVIIDKVGQLKIQLLLNNFGTINDLMVRDEQIYILEGKKVHRISLSDYVN